VAAAGATRPDAGPPTAWFEGRLLTGLVEVSSDLGVLDTAGTWAVVLTFEGGASLARFATVTPAPLPPAGKAWHGPAAGDWTSSLDEAAYQRAVDEVRDRIAAGAVYQANVCRVLKAPLPDHRADLLSLARVLASGNPAPYAGFVRLPEHGVHVACASPELFLRRTGRVVESSPIKGTGRVPGDLTAKDVAENVMIVDLVRNDLGAVAATGSVEVPRFLEVQQHPGLVHLVSTVRAELRAGVGWADVLAATFPPGSVSGAPKSTALRAIADLEPVPRGPYCGAIGWVDADAGTAELAVGIRTFWRSGDDLCFGTGAGITIGSDPAREWAETELKAARLVGLASR
jgi:para-aminobenzoate synthetase component 1